MDKQKEVKEIEKLKTAKFKEYTVDSFKTYWTQVDDYTSKKARVVNAQYIAVYSLWHKRLLARVFYFEEYMKYKKIHRYVFEVQRQVAGLSKKISCRLYHSTFCGFKVWTGRDDKGWEAVNANTYRLFPLVDNWVGKEYIGFIEFNGWERYLKKSIHQYSAYELLPYLDQKHNYMFEYLLKYEKHPQIEMLVKIGLPQVVNDLSGLRWSKKGAEMLGISKQEIPYLQSGMALKQYKEVRDWCLKYKFSADEAKKAYEFKHFKPYGIKLTFSSRLIRYLVANNVPLSDYADLIRTKNKLGLPNETRYLFPDDFNQMHDDLNDRVIKNESKEQDEKIIKYANKLKKYSLEKNGLMIRPASSTSELIKEGKKLHHCVGVYADRMANKETAIMLIRKSESIDEPFVTLELRDKKVIQVRGLHNNMSIPLDDDVKDFVRKWEKQFRLTGF